MSWHFDWSGYHEARVFTPEWYEQQPPKTIVGLWELGRNPEFGLWKVAYANPNHDDPYYAEALKHLPFKWRSAPGQTNDDYASRRSMTRHLQERGLDGGCIRKPIRKRGRMVEKVYVHESALSVYVSSWRAYLAETRQRTQEIATAARRCA